MGRAPLRPRQPRLLHPLTPARHCFRACNHRGAFGRELRNGRGGCRRCPGRRHGHRAGRDLQRSRHVRPQRRRRRLHHPPGRPRGHSGRHRKTRTGHHHHQQTSHSRHGHDGTKLQGHRHAHGDQRGRKLELHRASQQSHPQHRTPQRQRSRHRLLRHPVHAHDQHRRGRQRDPELQAGAKRVSGAERQYRWVHRGEKHCPRQ